ncbi:transcriptional coactivator p15/PC4 family protein [Bradyrhizobium sp. NBAIM20]|uniref:transcriptional coactivator p15/PC4 family protein n=1 Tax=unclassified Bradyrhizobium TaxID=2631580 RepID=UPI001CD352DB|nr:MULTISPECIES: transcriptional coactivator p15/PC4 family protein [unclassified Bradyrhizobium]MCA1414469.1 transcriptional coactivator p15/PC4 family protein [Bradyrhizobium sp. NBAIM20]MCA1459869.1 transcriptional coactivator p15/PC4 family protein [Bradyrhizobium sp. NBAIM18]
MSARKLELAEPVVVDRFFSNRRKDVITTTLQTYKGHALVDVRKHVHDKEGKIYPTAKGITMKVTRLPDLSNAIARAVEKARELGLLDGEDAE